MIRRLLLCVCCFVACLPAMAQTGGYRHFTASVYTRYFEVAQMKDAAWLQESWNTISAQVKPGKIYLETHRDRQLVDEATLNQAIAFFKGKGLTVAGGITLTISEPNRFETFCYSDPNDRAWVKKVVEFTAAHFDELILDDFFFTSCKNEIEIKAKGNRRWTDYRLALLREAARDLIIAPAKKVNPRIKVVVKYPNWYEHFQGLGFNLYDGPRDFDGIYTGTETRNAVTSAQHLQQYHGYSIFRYFDNLRPGHNGGGWVDTAAGTPLDRYAEQLWLTLFAKAPEMTLFDYRQLLGAIRDNQKAPWNAPDNSFDFEAMKASYKGAPTWALPAGYALEQVDKVLGELGNPIGIAGYRPTHATGEDFLHSFLGMIGLPMDLRPDFPSDAGTVLLTQSAAADKDIAKKIEAHIRKGNNVVVTSGLLDALGKGALDQVVELQYTGRKALVQDFLAGGFGPPLHIDQPMLIPQIQYLTNDSWELVSAIAGPNGWPLLHDADYAKGHLYVLTIPDNFADLYRLPAPVLTTIRRTLSQHLPVYLDAPGNVSLMVYDNNTVVVESFRDEPVQVKLVMNERTLGAQELQGRQALAASTVPASGGFGAPRVAEKTSYALTIPAHSFRVVHWQTVQAEARTDANSRQAHAELLAKKTQGRIDVYFEGDSITRRWGASDAAYADMLANWQQNFSGWNAADFGWGGDTVQNMLWRLEQGELSGVNPKVIVLLAGTNNIGEGVPAAQQTTKVQEVTGGITKIIARMQREAPTAVIALMGITPRNGKNGETAAMPVIDAINKQLATMADGRRVRYLNINGSLADANGKLFDGMTVDGLHLSVKGYQVWADALKPVFTELLGPPAKTDRAPPPTGDPSARR